MQMSGQSQDELCLLEMVHDRELAKFVARNANTIDIEIMGKKEKYNVLKVIEFSSDRKMMSVILQNDDTKESQVFSKGASDMMVKRLSEFEDRSPIR